MRGGNIKERAKRSSDGDEEAQWVSKELKTNMISAAAKKRSRENKADCMGKQATVDTVGQFQACTDIEERTPPPSPRPFLSSSLPQRTLFMAFCVVARTPVPHGGCGLLLHYCPRKSLAWELGVPDSNPTILGTGSLCLETRQHLHKETPQNIWVRGQWS